MSVVIGTLVAALSLTGPQAKPASVNTTRLRPLFDAIRYVESGNRPNPPDGDGGRSIGPYQIMAAYHQDGCGCGDWQACRQREHAEATMIGYWRRYAPRALARDDWKMLARLHNAGPRALKNPRLASGYWHRVKRRLVAK